MSSLLWRMTLLSGLSEGDSFSLTVIDALASLGLLRGRERWLFSL